MSIKVGRQSHDMRIFCRIVRARSAKQSVGIIIRVFLQTYRILVKNELLNYNGERFMAKKLFEKFICTGMAFLLSLCLIACDKTNSGPSTEHSLPDESIPTTAEQTEPLVIKEILTPSAPGTVEYGNSTVTIDASNASEGYIMVFYHGSNHKVKLQLTGPNNVKYTYNILTESTCLPLAGGSGTYTIGLFENMEGTQYSSAFNGSFEADISNEFGPFLYPNQYVNFAQDSKAVEMANRLASKAATEMDIVAEIYHYVTKNITYDHEEATTVAYNYLPDVDEVLETKKGICFDYASLMAAMLRSQLLPTRLEIGYAGDAYHAWISVYIKDVGWIDDVIYFDGKSWTLMDPTFAANMDSPKQLKKFIGDGNNYSVLYTY